MSVLRKLDPTNRSHALHRLPHLFRSCRRVPAQLVCWWIRIPPACIRRWRTNWQSAGTAAEAIENYRAALKIDPQLPGLHFELAEMLSTLSTTESREEAENEYKAALEANPLDEQAECRLGDIALRETI